MKYIKPNKAHNTVEVSLNKLFYSPKALEDSLIQMREICEGRIIDKKEEIVVILTPYEKYDLEELGLDFCNFVLSVIKNKGYA
jgi:hypothetical protein